MSLEVYLAWLFLHEIECPVLIIMAEVPSLLLIYRTNMHGCQIVGDRFRHFRLLTSSNDTGNYKARGSIVICLKGVLVELVFVFRIHQKTWLLIAFLHFFCFWIIVLGLNYFFDFEFLFFLLFFSFLIIVFNSHLIFLDYIFPTSVMGFERGRGPVCRCHDWINCVNFLSCLLWLYL